MKVDSTVEPINVLQLTFGLPIGGMEKVIQNLCRHLDRSRFNVMVCCLSMKGEFAEELEEEGYKVYVCSQKTRLNKYMREWEVRSILNRERIHVLHSHNTTALLDGLLGAKLARTPVLVHTDHVRRFPDKVRYMVAEKIASYFVDRVVAVSDHLKKDLIYYEGISPERISVIYNGTDFSPCRNKRSISEMRKGFSIKPGDKVIGCVAELREQKGFELFLRVAGVVLRKMANVKFLIVGDGQERADLENLSRTLGIESGVHFAGARTDIERVMSVFDLFLLTSHYEGMPICLLESMASGVPVVSTDVGGVPEVIQNGVSGYLVDSRDPGQIAQRVIELLSDDELRARMGKSGRCQYQSRFTVESMIRQYTELYEQHLTVKVAE